MNFTLNDNYKSACKIIAIIIILCLPGIASSTNETPKAVHVFVALCDNASQGIVPVLPELGEGNNPRTNLYWGALYGVKTFFKQDKDWKLIKSISNRNDVILETCVFKSIEQNVYLIADAYKGEKIKQSIHDFISAAGCNNKDTLPIDNLNISIGGGADLVAYIGHNGLMEFNLDTIPRSIGDCNKDAIVLACASRFYFSSSFRINNVNPLLWTTGLMAPEAYTLEAALSGWVSGENKNQIAHRAAEAYSKYQKCSLKSAQKLLVCGYDEDNN